MFFQDNMRLILAISTLTSVSQDGRTLTTQTSGVKGLIGVAILRF